MYRSIKFITPLSGRNYDKGLSGKRQIMGVQDWKI